MKNFKRGHRITVIERSIEFTDLDHPDSGFSFPATENFELDTSEMDEAGLENYNACMSGEFNVAGPFNQKHHRSYWESAVGECDCGEIVQLHRSLVNTCSCGREYNSRGQSLADRSCWSDDTGESVSEILQGNVLMGG